ncbi:MAG: PVC-type heme-binding CxxCH protein [Verrucomicrobiota bacterium]
MKTLANLACAVLGWLSTSLTDAAPVSLFDGKSLQGWEIRKGEEAWWKVEDGMIVGGSLSETVPFNTFLASTKSYGDFELSFKIRLIAGDGFINSGMQVRSERVANNSEMIGYQIDAGAGYWGDIYDELRRNIAVAKGTAAAAKDWEWNDYRVRCEGLRIQTWINGVQVTDYTEKDTKIPQIGKLGLQAHGGGKFLVQMKDIAINELPAARDGHDPNDQRASFTLPQGYTAELVASEQQGVGKPITVAWDRHGRMWTMTALEYPVDANESEDSARALYQHGGKDKVLVFDEPNKPEPQTPRAFAEGLAIPLGILPTKQGVYVQHGSEIRRYHDDDGDGTSDRFDVILEGFGIQDSHLFPHQFMRAPGNWIYLAQGAFNYSKVRRPGGLKFDNGAEAIDFNHCKLARFRPDGSAFEPLTGGPNNIWGLVTSRHGETFIQEANDLGYPVAEFAPGTHYPTFSGGKLRPDAPVLPPSTPNQPMGGTGLSGLALAEDVGSPFAQNQGDRSVFYVANPITSRIQVVTLTRNEQGHPVFQKGKDFMTSTDPWFRPIAIHFGPDGCLYVVDWYNKIISHNEVPRAHPDRDKTHGRIWRIRHQSQQTTPRVDVTKLTDSALVDLLGAGNALLASHAWQEIADRKSSTTVPTLEAIVNDTHQALPRRMGALWSLEGVAGAKPNLLVKLATATEPELRHEAVRIAGENSLPEDEFFAVISALGAEKHFRVRAAIANAVRQHRNPTAKIVACAASLGLTPAAGTDRASYDRNFERYLARWAMSEHALATREMLASETLPLEARLLAVRSHDDAQAAAAMVGLLPEITRPLTSDELNLLAKQIQSPAVIAAIPSLFANSDRIEPTLRALLQLDTRSFDSDVLGSALEEASFAMLREHSTPERQHLVVKLARKFRRTALTGMVREWLQAKDRSAADLAEGLASLREMGIRDSSSFAGYLEHADDAVRREALIGFASSDDIEPVLAELSKRWPALSGVSRSLVVNALTSSRMGPTAFAHAMAEGKFPNFEATALEKLIAALGRDHPAILAVLEANKDLLQPVLRFGDGGPGRYITHLTLQGPFTVEAWVKLPAPIDNNDGLLGRQGGPDINFAGAQLRVYDGDDFGDIIIADRPIRPDQWTHCAIIRDAENQFHLYLDGEPDNARGRPFDQDFIDFNVAETHRGRDTSAYLDEVRVWNIARSAEEIRRDAHSRFSNDSLPGHLIFRSSGSDPAGKAEGSATTIPTLAFPNLISPAEATALDERFDRFRKMAELPGDLESGKTLVRANCMICHLIQGEGTAIGPDLSGAGAMGVESLLRNILTPNAQLESGYYRHDLKLRNGSVLSGFLAETREDAVVLRVIGGDDQIIPRAEIVSHDISKRSLMPEGLLDQSTAQQVADLFSYLKTLR